MAFIEFQTKRITWISFQKPPHTLIWAKLKGYPFWPAKALREINGQVDVRFFGAHDRLALLMFCKTF